jgi:hypothetical protein
MNSEALRGLSTHSGFSLSLPAGEAPGAPLLYPGCGVSKRQLIVGSCLRLVHMRNLPESVAEQKIEIAATTFPSRSVPDSTTCPTVRSTPTHRAEGPKQMLARLRIRYKQGVPDPGEGVSAARCMQHVRARESVAVSLHRRQLGVLGNTAE